MTERRVNHWAQRRVVAHFLDQLPRPTHARPEMKALYRTLKTYAARIRRSSLSDIFPGIAETEIRVKYAPHMGGTSPSDLMALAQIAKFVQCKNIFEIGTFRGLTTYHLALNSAEKTHVWTLDLPHSAISQAKFELTDLQFINKPLSGELFLHTEMAAKITQLLGDSATFDFGPYQRSMDLVYVDGGHSFEYAMADSHTARRLLAPGGLVLWHDYPTYPGVWRCLEDLAAAWPGSLLWIEDTSLVLWRP